MEKSVKVSEAIYNKIKDLATKDRRTIRATIEIAIENLISNQGGQDGNRSQENQIQQGPSNS